MKEFRCALCRIYVSEPVEMPGQKTISGFDVDSARRICVGCMDVLLKTPGLEDIQSVDDVKTEECPDCSGCGLAPRWGARTYHLCDPCYGRGIRLTKKSPLERLADQAE